jgi:hypothetical protein
MPMTVEPTPPAVLQFSPGRKPRPLNIVPAAAGQLMAVRMTKGVTRRRVKDRGATAYLFTLPKGFGGVGGAVVAKKVQREILGCEYHIPLHYVPGVICRETRVRHAGSDRF